MERTGTGLVLAGGAAAISGVAVAVNGYGVRAFGDATAYTTAKNVVAGVLLTALAGAAWRWRAGAAPRAPADRATWVRLVAIAVVGGSVPFVLFFEGLARAAAADAAFLHKTLVVWVALLAVPLLHERLRGWHLVAIAVLLGGQVALLGGWPQLGAGSGELMILAATLLWSAEVIVAKQALADVPPATLALARMGAGSLVLIGWTVATRGYEALTQLSTSQVGWALLTGAILAAYVATWLAALARAGAVDVTAVLVAGAILTALIDGARGTVTLGPLVPGLLLLAFGTALTVVGAARRTTVT